MPRDYWVLTYNNQETNHKMDYIKLPLPFCSPHIYKSAVHSVWDSLELVISELVHMRKRMNYEVFFQNIRKRLFEIGKIILIFKKLVVKM